MEPTTAAISEAIAYRIAFWLGKFAVSRFRRWILGTIYSKDRLSKDIRIDSAKDTTVNMVMTANVNLPTCEFWLTIINSSPFDITLDRMPIELWLDQRLCDRTVCEVLVIKSRTEKNIRVSAFLNEFQVKAVKRLKSALPAIRGQAYFRTPLGDVTVSVQRENLPLRDHLPDRAAE